MFFLRGENEPFFKSLQNGGVFCSPCIAECTLTDLIRIWGVVEDYIMALDLTLLGLGATLLYFLF